MAHGPSRGGGLMGRAWPGRASQLAAWGSPASRPVPGLRAKRAQAPDADGAARPHASGAHRPPGACCQCHARDGPGVPAVKARPGWFLVAAQTMRPKRKAPESQQIEQRLIGRRH
jgi:hypothetical protein